MHGNQIKERASLRSLSVLSFRDVEAKNNVVKDKIKMKEGK